MFTLDNQRSKEEKEPAKYLSRFCRENLVKPTSVEDPRAEKKLENNFSDKISSNQTVLEA